MTNLDQLRAFLVSKGEQHIETNGLEPLVAESKMPRGSFMPAFYTLRKKGELSTEIVTSEGGRNRVVAVNLHKMPTVSSIIRNEGEKKKMVQKSKPPELVTKSSLTNLTAYMQKKTVIQEIQEKLAASGFTDEEVAIDFPIDPMGEEAIALLDLVGRAQTALNAIVEERDQLKIDLEAEKEINKRSSDSRKLRSEDYAQS